MTAAWVLGACGVAVGVWAWWLRRRFVIVTVAGSSMEPTYTHGDRVLARRTDLARIRVGDVVVAAPGRPVPGGPQPLTVEGAAPGMPTTRPPWLVKRVVAVPGDPLPDATLAVLAAGPGDLVPAGRFLVYGDNAAASADSRQNGYFHGEYLLGVVVARLRGPERDPARGPQRDRERDRERDPERDPGRGPAG